MKAIVLLVLLFVFQISLRAQQNLVPNSSFEDLSACPTNISGQYGDEIYKLSNWFPAGHSPDFFHTCSLNQNAVPSNGFGFQNPNYGSGYIGLYTIGNFISFPDYREYIGVQLTQSLNIGIRYYFTMYVSPAYGGPQGMHFFSNKLGAKLSTVYYESQTNSLEPDNASVGYTDSILTDTTNWVTLRFSFIADSAYQYLYLGNFFNDVNTDSIAAYGNTNGQGAYYFIDDICLSTDSNYCALALSITQPSKQSLSVYPNPTSDIINIRSVTSDLRISLFDLTGKKIKDYLIKKGENHIDISDLPAGNYFLKTDELKFYSTIIQKL